MNGTTKWREAAQITKLRLLTIVIESITYIRGLEAFDGDIVVGSAGDCSAAGCILDTWVHFATPSSTAVVYATDGFGICSIAFGGSPWYPQEPSWPYWVGCSRRNSDELSFQSDVSAELTISDDTGSDSQAKSTV